MTRKKTYAFQEIEQYHEYLEIKHLRSKNLIVSGVFLIMFILTILYMLITHYPITTIIPLSIGMVGLLLINFILSAYGDESNSYLRVNKYISTLGMFTMVSAMIIIFRSPSLIPLLFVAYCVCAIYQDIKVIIISNIYFVTAILVIVTTFPELLVSINVSNGTNFSIVFFSMLFLVMLSVSAYIISKEKSFFYNQISNSKEIEYRNIDLLLKLKYESGKDDKNYMNHYHKANELLKKFSESIELPNIFEEKINILIDLENKVSDEEILEKHIDFTINDLDRLKKLLISNNAKLNRIAIKMSNTRESKVKKREIFSATHFKSFNKPSESSETKIIAFVIFYVALKKGFIGIDKLSDKDIYNTITNTDYFYYIDSKIMRIYQENSDVFDAIISDAFSKGGNK